MILRRLSSATLNPDVLWSQKPDSVRITFNHQDLKDVDIKIEEKKLTFSGFSAGNKYFIEFEFYDSVKPSTQKDIHTGRCFICEIKKETSSKDLWPRLVSPTERQHWLRVDFSSWEDFDAEEEDEFSKMCPGPDLESYGNMGMNFDDLENTGNSDEDLEDGSSSHSSQSEEPDATPKKGGIDTESESQKQEAGMSEPVSTAEVSS